METTSITKHGVLGICYGRKHGDGYQCVDVAIVTAGGVLELALFCDDDVNAMPIVEVQNPSGAAVLKAAMKMRKGLTDGIPGV